LPAFIIVLLTVLPLTRFNEIASKSGEPVIEYALPSYLKVDWPDTGDPSAATPFKVRDMPPSLAV
jgi:hypothetical protein